MLGGREFTVDTHRHPRGWIVVPISAGIYQIQFVLNTGYLVSALNRSSRTVLTAMGFLRPASDRLFLLENLMLGGQPLPALSVHGSWALDLIDVEGMLGLDFLSQFADVHYNAPSGVLNLRG